MIYKLQKRLIVITLISVLAVVGAIFGVIMMLNITSVNRTMDTLTDIIAENGGIFPEFEGERPQRPGNSRPPIDRNDMITPDTRFATRFFTVTFNKDGEVVDVNSEFISAIDQEEAVHYAQNAVKKGKARGWNGDYRYGIYLEGDGCRAVFVDGGMNKMIANRSIIMAGSVLICAAAVVMLLIILLSRSAVKPIAESYDKQRQFVTDANHELKTPLTLILANVDIAESELGENEWLSDIRSEGKRMAALVEQLVSLSRMDEQQSLQMNEFSLTGAMLDTSGEFEVLAKQRKKQLFINAQSDINYVGNEALIRSLISILLDNAIKYCDEEGEIFVSLEKKRKLTLTVENTYKDVERLELNKLFDRFYRADKARSSSGGFGVGLSLAKAISQSHGAQISVYKHGSSRIGFKVTF